MFTAPALIRDDTGIKNRPNRLPGRSRMAAPKEQQIVAFHFHRQMNWPLGNSDTAANRKTQATVWKVARA
ncbi:hypothetical protein D3C87_2089600 [compost metagenome]